MAKLESLQMRKDDGERQIKCLVIESESGDVIKHYNPSEFQTIIKTVDKIVENQISWVAEFCAFSI